MASDSFTDEDGTALEDHDENWAGINIECPVVNLEINNNVVEHESTWDSSGAYYDGSSEDFCQIVDKAHDDGSKHVAVRAGVDQKGYAAFLKVGVEGNWTRVDVSKSGVFLASLKQDGEWPQANDHIIKITASGTTTVTIEVFVDGVSIGTTEDSIDPLGPGHPGFWTNPHGIVATSRWDDWTDGAEAGETFYQNAGQGVVAIAGSLAKAIVIAQNAGQGVIVIAGTLTTAVTFVKAIGDHAMTIVGTLVKKTSKSVGSGQVSPTGILSKKTSKDVGGGSVTSIGALTRTILLMQAVGGASMSIIGSLATQFIAKVEGVAKFLRRRKTFYKQ